MAAKGTRPSAWNRFVESAVQGGGTGQQSDPRPAADTRILPATSAPAVSVPPSPTPFGPRMPAVPSGRRRVPREVEVLRGSFARSMGGVRNRIADSCTAKAGAQSSAEVRRRRLDLRLALPAALVWGASVAGLWLPPRELAVLCCVLAGLGGLCLVRAANCVPRRKPNPVKRRSSAPRASGRRTMTAALGVSLVLAAATAAHSATASSQRFDGPLAEAAAGGRTVVAIVEVAGNPRAVGGAGATAERWSVPVWTREVSTGGVLLRTRARLKVMGGQGWGAVLPGQTLRATGKLRTPDPGEPEAANLAASTAPGMATGGSPLEEAARELRARFVGAAAFLPSDARGLLPGMVTGDTGTLDEGLVNAMKAVGMTHLTAVSGANCSLVLGSLLLLCRRFRLPRLPAAAAALAGLALFVVLVGPDASVLRAALMGAIGVASLAGGRTGRGLSFLCLAVIGLLLIEPSLGTSFGFLLSVLATLGIILLGRRIIVWIPEAVPRWLAAAVAVPLSAQLLCGPAIVLLQPQFATYSLLANVAVSPFVAPVTLLGTAAVPLVVMLPWAATVLMVVAGTCAAFIATTARFAAMLPGSALPWPEGVPGLLSMVLLSALSLAALWAVAHPLQVVRKVRNIHARTVALIEVLEVVLRRTRDHRSLDPGSGHGRLGYFNKTSERNRRWPLRKSEQPAPRHRIPPPGGTQRRHRSSW